MFIEVDVSEGPNCSWAVSRMFQAKAEPRPVSRITAMYPNGVEGLCDITGWSEEGPCPAYAVVVEDSGEGEALLVFGGDQGLRLKAASRDEPFDLGNSSQWGEPCLLLASDAEAV